MDRKAQVLTLLVFILVTSGCINGGGETQSEGDQAINVHELTAQPSQIYSGSSTNVILHISNGGELPANLTIDSNYEHPTEDEIEECDNYPRGTNVHEECILEVRQEASEMSYESSYADRVLTDRCRDFLDVEDFSVVGPEDTESDRYILPPRNEVRFVWVLNSPESANIPLNGYECNLRFQVPFDYSVNAYRQIQFKESRDVEGAPNLESRSSQGPMMLNIETIGSTSDQHSTFIDGDNAEVIISLINQGEEGTSYTGFIEAEVPEINVNAEGFSLEDDCGDLDQDTLTMYEGESQTIRCSLIQEDENLTGSMRGEVTASTDYEYVQNIGTRTVEVEYRGN